MRFFKISLYLFCLKLDKASINNLYKIERIIMYLIKMVEQIVEDFLSVDGEEKKRVLEDEFNKKFGFQRNTPPCFYPLASEVGLDILIDAAVDFLKTRFPSERRIVGLGQSPAWLIITAALMEYSGVSNRHDGVAFSGSFPVDRALNKIIFGEGSPTPKQIEYYRDYLLQKKLDPKNICDNFSEINPLVLVEHTETGKGLASFLSILSDWARELSLDVQLKKAIKIHLLIAPNTFPFNESFACGFNYAIQKIDPNSEYSTSIYGGFLPRDVRSDFTWTLTHSDQGPPPSYGGDRVLPSFKLSKCEEYATHMPYPIPYPEFAELTLESQRLVLARITYRLIERKLLSRFFFLSPEEKLVAVHRPPKAAFFKFKIAKDGIDMATAVSSSRHYLDTDVSSEKFDREIMKTPVC